MHDPEETMTFDAPSESHPAKSRRERLAQISRDFSHVPVRVGTQQAVAIETVRTTAQTLAKQISEFCPDGPESELAIQFVMQAKMWATQAISHRE